MQAVAIIGDGVRLSMVRLTELKLPLDHAESEIKAAVLKRLQIGPQDLVGYSVFRRAADARKRSAISLIYTLDIDVRNEAALLKRLAGDRNLSLAPNVSYRIVTRADLVAVVRALDRRILNAAVTSGLERTGQGLQRVQHVRVLLDRDAFLDPDEESRLLRNELMTHLRERLLYDTVLQVALEWK